MNAAAVVRQPVGCLKAALRRTRFQRSWQRCMATEATPTTTTTTNPSMIRNAFSQRQRMFSIELPGRDP
jgi:hypothetical protein